MFPPKGTQQWRLLDDYNNTAEQEAYKGPYITLLAGIGRVLSNALGRHSNKLRLGDIAAKEAGRLVNWCMAHMGITGQAALHDSRRGAAPPAKPKTTKQQTGTRERKSGESSKGKQKGQSKGKESEGFVLESSEATVTEEEEEEEEPRSPKGKSPMKKRAKK